MTSSSSVFQRLSWMTPVVLLLLTCGPIRCQVLNGKSASSDESFVRAPVLDLSVSSNFHQLRSQAASSTEQNRSARYDKARPPLFNESHPERSDSIRYTSYVDYENYDPLPASASDIVAVGTIKNSQVHLSQHGTGIYSTFDFLPTRLLKGVQQGSAFLQVEKAGGLVKYPSGKLRFEGNAGEGLPTAGHQYVLFLKRVPNGNSFQIISGFCVDGDHVLALDNGAKQFDSHSPTQLLTAVTQKLSK